MGGSPVKHYKPWAEEDIHKLCEEYQTKGATQLAVELERTYSAVQSRAQSLDITRKDFIHKFNPSKRPEVREKIRRTLVKRNKEHPPLPKASWFGVGHTPWNKNLTKETDERVAKNVEGRGENQRQLWQDPNYRENQLKAIKGKTGRKRIPFETRICACGECGETFECKVNSDQRFIWGHNNGGLKHSNFMKEIWKDPEFVAKQMIARNVCPNKAEKFLDGFFQNLFPNEYKFVGNGQFILAGKCPDFINVNGQKKIIELFGEHVHKPEEEQQRIDLFVQYGYQTLIIWYSELSNIKLLTEKLLSFNE